MRLLAISDIHGQLDKFKQLLQLCKYNKDEDQLVLLGDYTDRGYQNIDTLKYIIELQKDGAIILKGNHDQLTELSIKEILTNKVVGNVMLHKDCGGENTINELLNTPIDELLEIYTFLKSLPLYYEYDKYILCHSGVDANKPICENTEEDLLWSRWDFINSPAYKDKIIIFGHTVTYSMDFFISKANARIWIDPFFKDKIGIDCGGVYGGKLCCYSVLEGETYYM